MRLVCDPSPSITDMIGRVFVKIVSSHDELEFIDADGNRFRFFHAQDCCETVEIESIVGDLNDLLGEPMLRAEESTSVSGDEDAYEHQTFTFYKFATRKGYVDVRWVGSSNGYYSDSVDLEYYENDE